MRRHVYWLLAMGLLTALCMVLPYLPGEYDALAWPLSMMAQAFAIAGSTLVPLGLVWLVYELKQKTNVDEATSSGTNWDFRFLIAAIALGTLVATAMAIAGFVSAGPALGIGVLALWAYCAKRLIAQFNQDFQNSPRRFNPAPLYLIVLPLAALAFRAIAIEPASEASRRRVIENSTTLLAEIEQYRNERGSYPVSLLSVGEDYNPGVMGVRRYFYEPNGEVFNLYFEHPCVDLAANEVVMYNKLGQQDMSSHNRDLLELSPTDIEAQRGHFAERGAGAPHWKIFLFD